MACHICNLRQWSHIQCGSLVRDHALLDKISKEPMRKLNLLENFRKIMQPLISQILDFLNIIIGIPIIGYIPSQTWELTQNPGKKAGVLLHLAVAISLAMSTPATLAKWLHVVGIPMMVTLPSQQVYLFSKLCIFVQSC